MHDDVPWQKRSAGEIVALIDRWISMANELPADPEQVLRDLRGCIKREGAYSCD